MLYAIVAVIAVILDQLVKYVVESHVVLDAIGADIVRLIPGFVHVTNVHNYGAAFSFLQGARWFFVVLCIVFVLVVVYILIKDIINTPVARWMAVFVLAGAVGNCIDRIICGYVVDMFEFEFFRFPVFNVADIYITVGAIVFCLCILLEKPEGKTKKVTASVIPQEDAPVTAPAAPEVPKERGQRSRKHQKTEIPSFPKRAPAPPAPAIDPNDPFAEWEKRANTPKETPPQDPAHVVYTQPVAAETPTAPEVPESAPTPPVKTTLPEIPAAPAAPETPAKETDSYDLDDILAEFKDL